MDLVVPYHVCVTQVSLRGVGGRPQRPPTSTGVLWVSCREPQVRHRAQVDTISECQPVLVCSVFGLVVSCCGVVKHRMLFAGFSS